MLSKTFSTAIREIKRSLKSAVPYIAELGVVAFVTVFAIAVAEAAAEFWSPGITAGFISPGALVTAAVVSGALSLVAPVSADGTTRRRLRYAAVAFAAIFFSSGAVWSYSSSAAEARVPLTAAAGLTVLLVFLVFGRQRN